MTDLEISNEITVVSPRGNLHTLSNPKLLGDGAHYLYSSEYTEAEGALIRAVFPSFLGEDDLRNFYYQRGGECREHFRGLTDMPEPAAVALLTQQEVVGMKDQTADVIVEWV